MTGGHAETFRTGENLTAKSSELSGNETLAREGKVRNGRRRTCLGLDDARGKCQPLHCTLGICRVTLLVTVIRVVTFRVHRPETQKVLQGIE